MNILTLINETVNNLPTKTAIIESGQKISYKELQMRSEWLSAAFYKIGLQQNHRVALLLPNSSDFIYCFLSLVNIRAVVCPLRPEITPFELKNILHNLNPHAIISTSSLIKRVYSEYPSILNNKTIILQSRENNCIIKQKCYDLRDLFHLGKNYRVGSYSDSETSGDHIATINYTYRGNGYPLGAMLSHRNYTEGVSAYIENTKMSCHHRVLSLLPLSHVYPLVGCMLAPLVSGSTIILSRNFMPRSLFQIIDNLKINHITAVPTIYVLMLQSYNKNQYDLSSLSCCITGGAYMSLEMIERIKSEMSIELLQGYGLTECLPVTWNRYIYNKTGTLGLPLRDDFQIKIVGDDGECKDVGQVGEIAIHAPTVMQGYYNHEQETQKVLKDGWLHTGDYGYLNDKGYLHFAGLKKNIAKVSGNMVDLKEVEDVFLSHSLISDISIYLKEDDLWGHVLAVDVESRINGKLNENDIKTFCGSRLSKYKIPKKIQFIEKVN